ncbi:MAG: FkbM family methyltransferase [Actinomycetota bacterium]|nr:FkbM family methyltransferase [Actinomycetota bacterium]
MSRYRELCVNLRQLVTSMENPRAAAHALLRFAAWQTWRRTIRRPVTVTLYTGGRLSCPPWSRTASPLVTSGTTEPRDQTLVTRLMRRGDVFIDVGANIGLYSVVAGMAGATVVSFEPSTDAAAILDANVRLNRLESRTFVRRHALGAANGLVSFTSGLDVLNHVVDDGAVLPPSSVSVPMRRLDSLFEEVAAPRPVGGKGIVVLKVDVEGYELEVLRGAENVLRCVRPIVLIETISESNAVMAHLRARGYVPFTYDIATNALHPLPDGRYTRPNTLVLPRAAIPAIQLRLDDAVEMSPAACGKPPSIRWRKATV